MAKYLFVFLLVFGSIGIAGWLILVFQTFFRASKSRTWPTVQGVVIEAGVQQLTRDRGPFNRFREGLKYEYQVDGKTYTSSILSLADLAVLGWQNGARSRGLANRIIRKYPKGKLVTVYYDPHNPSLAVLNTDIFNANLILVILIFLVMISFMVALLSLAFKA